MKLRNRIFILLSLEWLVLLCFIYGTLKILSQLHFKYNFTIIAILLSLFFIIIIGSLYIFVFKKIEKLNSILFSNDTMNHKIVSEQDELTSILDKVYLLKEKANDNNQNLNARIKELQIRNDQLQKEISQHKLIEHEYTIHKEQLVRLAHYDYLTSLPNRIFFNDILNKAISDAKRKKKILAILVINLDHFKIINAKYSHKIGDEILKEISPRFKEVLRTADVIARLSGDEFIVLLHDVDNPKFVGVIADKLLFACKQKIKVNHNILRVTSSIGISIYPTDGESLEDLQMHADMAMYRAKHAGGDNYQFFGQAMGIAAQEHAKLNAMLKHAITHNDFVLHYQPQLNLASGTINSVEALIRWYHPTLGLLGPEEFIPFTEETGLITQIGDWVLHEACRANKNWQNEGYEPITVTVNISPKQFQHENLTTIIKNVLQESKLAPEYLGIEITESAMIVNLDVAIDRLKCLHDLGVKIYIDDFGTGYTSINYLKKLPVDILKIDQSFIKGIPYNSKDMAITSAIISLGHRLGLKIVAEGVETTEQIQFLAEQKCDLIQGYFLSRPLPANKLVFQFRKKTKQKIQS